MVSISVTRKEEGTYDISVDDLTSTFKVTAAPAEFTVSGLMITPSIASLGEDVEISAKVTNVGGVKASREVKLKINQEVVDAQTVTVGPGKSTRVTFIVSKSVPGTFPIEVDGLRGSFIVEREPAEFKASELSVTPEVADPGEDVLISAKVTNMGGKEGDFTAEISVDGVIVKTVSVTLSPGQSKTVQFATSKDEKGTYEVELDGQTGSFEVKKKMRAVWPIVVIVVSVIALLIVGVWYWRVKTPGQEGLAKFSSTNSRDLPDLRALSEGMGKKLNSFSGS